MAGVEQAQTLSLASPFGQLVQATDLDPQPSAGIAVGQTLASFGYDAAGAIATALRQTGYAGGTYAQVARTVYAYDAAARLKFVGHGRGGTSYATATKLAEFIVGQYDAAGRISQFIDVRATASLKPLRDATWLTQ